MSAGEHDDLKLQRASASFLSAFQQLLPRLLWTRKHGSVSAQVRQHVRESDMQKACGLIEPFQEDPQLLDTHLKSFIPPLVAAFLEAVRVESAEAPPKGFVPLSQAICCILNTFCKVRGEKVIKGFFNNEPRYLEPILRELEVSHTSHAKANDNASQPSVQPWVERHILLLWLSHLLLAPFPLESMSALQSSVETSKRLDIQLPEEMPEISLRVLTVCLERLQSASKERSAAANLLVRLCVRPDMQKLGLLHTMVDWSLSFFSKISEEQADIHQCLGVLSFLSGLVVSATNEEIGPDLAAIYQSCRRILDAPSLEFVRSSAVARKVVVKTLRTIVIHCLQSTLPPVVPGLDPTSALEEVIEFLLEALADGDTPVRYGASKALSIITLKLDDEMAGEVVEAILGSLTENIYWQGSKRNLNSVNPLRWHGLTLTLSQLLYRKAISRNHLPDVLNALLLSLGFEQRSPTGGSIGTNVRDAACFGIWALARRYSTADLLSIDTTLVRASEHHESVQVPQVLAIELVVAACLDPAGNIRRGSSAALQELIGRHPNSIEEGIPLVQIVDFHAVGLRQRAMCEVALKAGELHPVYWDALFEHLLEWRGTGSLDAEPRLFAAKAIGLLSASQAPSSVSRMLVEMRAKLTALRPREVEERQGLVSALAALVRTVNLSTASSNRQASCKDLMGLWGLFDTDLHLEDKAFTSPALRPGFTAASICSLIGALASMTVSLPSDSQPRAIPVLQITRLLNLCLTRHEEPVLEAISSATPAVLQLLLPTQQDTDTEGLLCAWLATLENESSYSGLRCSGQAVALGASYSILADRDDTRTWNAVKNRIVNVLTFRCTSAVAIEARTVALQALGTLLSGLVETKPSLSEYLAADAKGQIGSALHVALNDYTITERGDVGSLVRLEALNTVRVAWKCSILDDEESEWGHRIYADVIRLSLEKLDKMRVTAAHVLRESSPRWADQDISTRADDVSSATYFLTTLRLLLRTKYSLVREAICIGYVHSAGMGSESVVQHARAALVDFIDTLPNETDGETGPFSLIDLVSCLTRLIKENLGDDRRLLPLLEVMAFLFDMQIVQRLPATRFSFRTLLSLTQKAHFKSTHMQKLQVALDMYRGLGSVPATRSDTLAKVKSMLLHPFSKIRIAAAETLWLLTGDEGLKRHDWSLPSKRLKPAVADMAEASNCDG